MQHCKNPQKTQTFPSSFNVSRKLCVPKAGLEYPQHAKIQLLFFMVKEQEGGTNSWSDENPDLILPQ